MRPWYKKWPSDYPAEYYACSERARHVFDKLLDACGRRESHDGWAMIAEGVLQIETAIPLPKMRLAMVELENQGLIETDGPGRTFVPFFAWQQREIDRTAGLRKQRQRERDEASVTVFHGMESVTVTDQEEKRDKIPSPPSAPTGGRGKPGRPRVQRMGLLDPPWLFELREALEPLRPRLLESLSAEEQFVLARIHAADFGYCRVKEPINKSRAGGVATSLSHLVRYVQRNIAGVTVEAYLTLAKRHHERVGRGVWMRPWDLIADLDSSSE